MKPLDHFRAIVAGEADPPPVAKLIGFAMTEIEPGRAVFEMDAGPQHASPLGTLHGGVICDLVDGAMGCAHASQLDEGETFTTLELKTNYLRQVVEGKLTATGRVHHAGRTIGLATCDVVDEQGRLVAHATSTCMTLREDRS